MAEDDDDEIQSLVSSNNDYDGGMGDSDPQKPKSCPERYEGDKFIWDQEEIIAEN